MRKVQRQPPAPHPGALLLKKRKQQMTADFLRGKLSLRELCAKYECTAPTLRNILKDQGAASNKRLRVKIMYKAPPARFLADARRGVLTRRELATKHELSYGAACAHIRAAEIVVPRALATLPARVTAKVNGVVPLAPSSFTALTAAIDSVAFGTPGNKMAARADAGGGSSGSSSSTDGMRRSAAFRVSLRAK